MLEKSTNMYQMGFVFKVHPVKKNCFSSLKIWIDYNEIVTMNKLTYNEWITTN